MRRKREREGMRRLRAGLVTPPPGGLGSPSVPTKGDCLEWLDAVRTKGGESRLDQGAKSFPSAPGSTAPGTKNRRRGAPRGARAPDNGARHETDTGSASRRSTPRFVEGR